MLYTVVSYRREFYYRIQIYSIKYQCKLFLYWQNRSDPIKEPVEYGGDDEFKYK